MSKKSILSHKYPCLARISVDKSVETVDNFLDVENFFSAKTKDLRKVYFLKKPPCQDVKLHKSEVFKKNL